MAVVTHVVVTGASGFVGRHLVPALREAGHEVIVAGRRATSRSEHNALELGDLSAPQLNPEQLRCCHTIIHLAALAHQPGSQVGLEDKMMEVNAVGAAALARVARRAGVQRFIYMSSIGAVATYSETTIDETTKPQPDTPYGRSKLQGEQLVGEALEDSATELVRVRPPLIYGRGNPGNMGRLLRLLRTGIPLPLGAIRNRRSFLYIENLCDAMVRLVSLEQAPELPVLIADDGTLSTTELLRELSKIHRIDVRLVRVPQIALRSAARVADPLGEGLGWRTAWASTAVERLCASLEVNDQRSRGALGWQPRFDVKRGLRAAFGVA